MKSRYLHDDKYCHAVFWHDSYMSHQIRFVYDVGYWFPQYIKTSFSISDKELAKL